MLLGISPKKAINLYGPAGSGKSTYINAGVNLGGGYHNTLYANYSQIGKDDFLTQIKNKKIIAGMDNEDGIKLIKILNILKSLLSHESFSYSVKYESPRTNIFNGVFIQAFNVSPDFRSQGSAQPIIDRMIITKIDNRFRNSENENRKLGEFFNQHNTLSQLAKYLLTTVDAFDDFEEPDKELSENLIEGDDSVKQFFEELELSGALYGKIISRSHLYIAYKHFCKENEHDYPSGEKSFYNKIEQYLEKYDFKLSVNEQTGLGNRKIKSGLNNEGLHELINLPDHYEGPSKGYYYERPDFTLNHNEQLSLSEICYICADKLVEAKKEKDLLINYTLGKEILEEILEGNQNRELINEKLSEMILD
jgi:phage/plasmid-associated DNA primase